MSQNAYLNSFFIVLTIIFCQPIITMAQTSKEVMDKMIYSVGQLKSVSYATKISERIDGKLASGTNRVKVNFQPFKAYLKLTSAEVLFIEGENSNKALVKTNAVPYFNLNLDPKGSIIRKGQHHTLFELGFNYFTSVIKEAYKKVSPADFDKYFLMKGSIKWDGKDCYVIVMDYPEFQFEPYQVQKGENIIEIAKKFKVSEYMILERNPELKDYYSVKAGQKIMIPNAYAQKTIIYIDKETYLPIVQVIYDDKGIFARYEFQDVVVNPVFSDEEFTKGFKDYTFW
jgi:LysM repeat protein